MLTDVICCRKTALLLTAAVASHSWWVLDFISNLFM